MSPDFLSGDFVIVWCHPWQRWQSGDDVVIKHGDYGIMLKRIVTVIDNHYVLTGLHPDSITTAAIGIQPADAIIGKLLYHIRKPRQSC